MALSVEKEAPKTSPPFNKSSLVWLALIVGSFLYLYFPVLTHLIYDWSNNPDYSHGFLVPLLSLFFLKERWEKFAQTPAATSWLGLVVICFGLFVLFAGHLSAELFSMRFSMIILITGLTLYHFGIQRLRVAFFPIAFLCFMIPLPAILLNTLTFPLQLLAAKFSTFSLQLVHLPVYREGNVIFLPHATLEVVEACSGLRSLMSLLTLSVVFAYMTQKNPWKFAFLVISAIPIAIVANAFRIWGTGVLAYFFGMQAADGFYHTFAGWLVFVVAFILLSFLGFLLSRFGKTRTAM